jgi:parallel beta-helix repeat protein
MLRRLVRASIAVSFALAATLSLAAEGRTPVWSPGTVLAADGKYIVTRNMSIAAGPVLTIGAPNVDLDLNGFTLSAGGGAPVISVLGGSDHVAIRNGVITGGAVGIDVPGPTRKVDIEDVRIHDTGTGIHAGDVDGAAIRRVEVTDATAEGISWNGPGSVKHGSIEKSLFRRTAAGIVVLNNCSSVGIHDNRLEEPGTGGGGSFPGFGIVLQGCGAALVTNNTIERSLRDGIFLVSSKGNKLEDNVVRTAGGNGIRVDAGSSDNYLLHNVCTGGGTGALPTGGSGLMIESLENVADQNVLNGNAGIGLHYCGPGACANTLGRNTARGNVGAIPAFCGACAAFGAGALGPNSCNTAAACAVPNTSSGANLIPGPPTF